MSDTWKCPQCDKDLPTTSFECRPLDLRCNRCIPQDKALELYDQRVKQAGTKLSRILDASAGAKGLKPLERMVTQCYDAWGGSAAFCEDVVEWIKDLASQGRGKGAAVNAAMKLLALHGKVDRMKLEDDWKQMDDATIQASLKMRLRELMVEVELEDGKKDTMGLLLEGDAKDA